MRLVSLLIIMKKLDCGKKHILKLIARDRNENGWTKVGENLYKPLAESIPRELAVFEKLEDGGRAKLTPEGQGVIDAMEWL